MAMPSQDLMHCSICDSYKSPIEMTAQSRKGIETRCKVCQNGYQTNFRKANRKEQVAYHREWRAKNAKKLQAQGVARRKLKISLMTPQELKDFRKKESDKTKRLSAVLKDTVFNAYGGWKCACCGETEKLFLTIDHMLNNASELRKEGVHGHSTQFYRWLKNSGYPKDFQVLCMNCNFGKRMNNGVCPHQVRCNDYRKHG